MAAAAAAAATLTQINNYLCCLIVKDRSVDVKHLTMQQLSLSYHTEKVTQCLFKLVNAALLTLVFCSQTEYADSEQF